MLALKLVLVPIFLLLVSMSGKWWGPKVAGWLAGFPVVAGPILFFLALDKGPVFAAQAAVMSLAAICASEAFNFAYSWTCRCTAWPGALMVGMLFWLAAALALSRLPVSVAWAACVATLAVMFGQRFLPQSGVAPAGLPLHRRDLALRMIAGAALTVTVTFMSSVLGAKWSGLLAVFPLLGIVLSVSSQRTHGPDFVVALFRGMVLGRVSFATFCLSLAVFLPRQGIAPAFVEAVILAMFVQWGTYQMRKLVPVISSGDAEIH